MGKNKKVIILGASGFIGREVSRLFLEKKENVELYAKHQAKINGCPVRPIDISRENVLSRHLKGRQIKAIIYLAAKIPKDISRASWDLLLYNLKLHKVVLESWINTSCHLVYASTASVYGHSDKPWREKNTVYPNNYYSFSKYIGEKLFISAAKENGLPLTILRINAPFGMNRGDKSVVNIFIEQALKGKDITLFGSGSREQDFIHIYDVAQAFWLAFSKKKNGIYNIASGRSVNMGELATVIKRLSGSASRIITSNHPDPQEKRRVMIDISRSKKELGFSPSLSLEDGLTKCIIEYKSKFL